MFLFGQSIGCAFATYTLTNRWNFDKIDPQELFCGVILECPFTTLEDAFYHKVPYLAPLFSMLGFFENLNCPNIDRIGKITIPIIILHGTADGLIPFQHSKELYTRATNARYKELVAIVRANHDRMHKFGDQYFPPLIQFMNKF